MGNKLPDTVTTGTIGEILCQLRLLEFGVQAAPPIKDSGNDLIAIRGEVVKYIQVKTSLNKLPQVRDLPEVFHLVFLVNLMRDESDIHLDDSEIIVLSKNNGHLENVGTLNQSLVNELWSV
jgi:hypothetical protein